MIFRKLVAASAVLMLFATTCRAAIRAEAFHGEPYGIGRVTVDLSPGASSVPWGDDRFALVEADGRAMYPVLENAPVRRLVRQFLGIETPWQVTYYFMFRGDEPLDLTLYSPDAQQLTIRPENRPNKFRDLQNDWWKATENRFQRVYRQAEYPVLVENYLASTWARRLGRELPEPRMYLLRTIEWGDSWVSQLTANETYQVNVERNMLLGQSGAGEQATITLPAAGEVDSATGKPASTNSPSPELLPAPAPDQALEPIASHVPSECFYLRFGNFPNYLWFRDFLNQSQGDLGNMIVLKAIDHGNSNRLQQQLAVGESAIARVMGPAVINDVAIIGLDSYLRDGAAMGILFYAKNNLLLGNNLSEQRHSGMATHKDAKEETVRIAGHDVSYVSSPDGELRSYYAVDGDYHLVATSRRLVERFFEAGAGTGSLAASTQFQDARIATPLSRDDTAFLFLSADFLNHLSSPHYRVELDRRLRSIGEMRALQLARLAAAAEGLPAKSIDELVAADFLPRGFGQRADGSRLIETDGGFRDSVRGEPGAMLPVADVPVEKITPTESRCYAEFQQGIQARVGNFVPISLAIQRTQSPVNAEWDHIGADVRLAPYSQTRLAKWANMLGPAEPLRVGPIAGDVASIEVIINALNLPVHLFAGMRDFLAPLVIREGEVRTAGSPADYLRGYVGTWPRPWAVLQTLFGKPTGPFDDHGIARNDGLFDLWHSRLDDFFVFAFTRDVLQEVGPQLAMVEPERPAQIRVQLDDLSEKQIATSVNAFGYMRARDASASGARFMNSLASQLHVPPQEARALAEHLVGGKFDCPLGGDYKLIDTATGKPASAGGQNGEELPMPGEFASATGRQLWISTATPPENRFFLTSIPADYTMPLMNWFRGMSAEVARANDAFTLHADLNMVRIDVAPPTEPEAGGFQLPSLPSLGSLFGGSGEKKDEPKRDDQVKPAAAIEDIGAQDTKQ
ncbi:MAG: hypothetical protein WD468_08630 [Pirellulales bacterium]